MLRIRFSSAAALLSVLLWVTTAVAGENHDSVVSIAVENISLVSVTADRMQLSANVSLLSPHKAVLEEVVFAQLNAGGVLLYASPVSQRVVLIPNQKVLPSRPLRLTVYLRDLSTLKPLRSLVANEKVSITGMAYASVDLTTPERLILRTRRVRVPVRIASTVEVRIPGGAFAKSAALALIDYAQAGLDSAGSAWQTGAKLFSEQRQRLWKDYAPGLVLAHATFQLQDANGSTSNFESTAMGFRIGGYQVVLPKSVLEPWMFDPYVAASMKADHTLKVSNFDLTLWPTNARLRDAAGHLSVAQAWRLSTQQLRLLPFTRDDDEPMFLPMEDGKTVRVRVHRREGAAALGLVEITDHSVPPMSPVLSAPGEAPDLEQSSRSAALAVFRFPEGIEAQEANPKLLLISARQGTPQLELDTPIDSTGWGSPVISRNGIVGVVTSENGMVPIAEAGKALNFSTNQQSAGGER